jgi:hypothetical protein
MIYADYMPAGDEAEVGQAMKGYVFPLFLPPF